MDNFKDALGKVSDILQDKIEAHEEKCFESMRGKKFVAIARVDTDEGSDFSMLKSGMTHDEALANLSRAIYIILNREESQIAK